MIVALPNYQVITANLDSFNLKEDLKMLKRGCFIQNKKAIDNLPFIENLIVDIDN